MRMGISAVPQDNVEVKQDRGVDVVFMYKDVRQETDAEGNKFLTANVQRIEYPAGADKADIVAHFDYYFDKAEAKEVAEYGGLKIAHVQALLTGSDYKPHKVFDGVMTAEEYAPWKELRQHWRDAINAMKACKTCEEIDNVIYAETPEGLAQLASAGLV